MGESGCSIKLEQLLSNLREQSDLKRFWEIMALDLANWTVRYCSEAVILVKGELFSDATCRLMDEQLIFNRSHPDESFRIFDTKNYTAPRNACFSKFQLIFRFKERKRRHRHSSAMNINRNYVRIKCVLPFAPVWWCAQRLFTWIFPSRKGNQLAGYIDLASTFVFLLQLFQPLFWA